MARRLLHSAAVGLTLLAICGALAACGGGDDSDTTIQGTEPQEAVDSAAIPGDAEHEDVAVIAGWANTLREGDVEGAAEYFAIPSTAINGGLMLRIRTADDAIAFNESLPCGAELIRAEAMGETVTAIFRLTERPGPGACGDGTGELAQTAFEIEDGEISEWRRVGEGAPQAEDNVV